MFVTLNFTALLKILTLLTKFLFIISVNIICAITAETHHKSPHFSFNNKSILFSINKLLIILVNNPKNIFSLHLSLL